MNAQHALPTSVPSLALLQHAIDVLEEPFFVKDLQHRWIICNHAFCQLVGAPRDAIIGHSDPDYFPPEQARVFWQFDDQVFDTGESVIQESELTSTSGSTHSTYTRKSPLRDEQGAIIGLCGIITDITVLRQRQYHLEQMERQLAEQAATVEHQRLLIEQVSVPIIQLWDHIVLLPLIGIIDSYRARRIIEAMLAGVEQARGRVLILDITGVPLVDTQVASHLVQAIQAAQLLGCQSVLVGVSPHIAETFVHLGIDFSAIPVRPTLQQGLAYALGLLNQRVV